MSTSACISQPVVEVGELIVNLLKPEVRFRGNLLKVNKFEYEVLRYLALRPSPAKASQLLEHIAVQGEKPFSYGYLALTILKFRRLFDDRPGQVHRYLPRLPQKYVLRAPK